MEVFEVPVKRVEDVNFPRIYLGNGATLTIGGARLRFSFIKPQNARMPTVEESVSGVRDLGAGRRAGQAWKAVLSERGAR